MLDLLIKNAKVCTSSDLFRSDIGIKDQKIVQLQNNITTDSKEVFDAKDKFVLPGGVDGHCHLSQPTNDGSEFADNFETGTRSAAYGGTTTVIPFALQFKGQSLRKVIDDYHLKAKDQCYVDYAFHTIITDANKTILNQELPAIIKDGYTHFKIYMTYDDLKLNDREILEVLEAAGREKATVMVHAENHECINWLTEKLENEGKTQPKYHADSRPDIIEAEATNRAISLSRLTNTPILFVHISGREAIEAIRNAQSKGFKIYAETCPQYLFLERDNLDLEGFEGAKYICSPPPRTKEDQAHVWNGLSNGTFDVFSSDHSPFNFNGSKGKAVKGKDASFKNIPNGIPGLETRLALLFSGGVLKNKISINKFVELTSTKPAKIYGLYPNKGTIAIGSDADLVIWDTNIKKIIKNTDLHHNVDYTPYENIEVNAWPNSVVCRGKIIVNNYELLAKKGFGKFQRSELSNYVY